MSKLFKELKKRLPTKPPPFLVALITSVLSSCLATIFISIGEPVLRNFLSI